MTQIGSLTLDTPVSYRYSDYQVQMRGSQVDADDFTQLREMFAKAKYGSTVHPVPGRPLGEDLTDGLLNTKFIQFTHGTTGKPLDGYYLLLSGYGYSDDETPEGHSYVFTMNIFYLGSRSQYSEGFRCKNIEERASEWNI